MPKDSELRLNNGTVSPVGQSFAALRWKGKRAAASLSSREADAKGESTGYGDRPFVWGEHPIVANRMSVTWCVHEKDLSGWARCQPVNLKRSAESVHPSRLISITP